MSLLDKIKDIPIINDHTHIFGCGAPEYDDAGKITAGLTSAKLISQLSWMNMNETALTAVINDNEKTEKVLLGLYKGRKTTFPVRASVRMYREYFGFEYDELTVENAPSLVETLKSRLPEGTEDLYGYIGLLSNTDIWFCNHGNLKNYDKRTASGKFRWVPYYDLDNELLNKTAHLSGFGKPHTLDEMRLVVTEYVKKLKKYGAVAIKGGAFAYDLDRPFAPDLNNIKKAEASKQALDSGRGGRSDTVVLQDALTVMCAEAAGIAGIPVQIHVGLIWTANGPTRIPDVRELTPLFYNFPDTTFVIFHGGYPDTDDLAYITATMTNVKAEFNWVPFWSGMDFPNLIGKWIDMIPNDRILYGTDGMGLLTVTHDMITREGLAEALEARIGKGYLSVSSAVQIAAGILRNNAIDTYKLDLPKYFA